MKKTVLFALTMTLFWGIVKVSQKSKLTIAFFTRQEQEILNLFVLGCEVNEIAQILHTSDKIIQQHQRNILKKTNSIDISAAIEYALGKKLVSISYA